MRPPIPIRARPLGAVPRHSPAFAGERTGGSGGGVYALLQSLRGKTARVQSQGGVDVCEGRSMVARIERGAGLVQMTTEDLPPSSSVHDAAACKINSEEKSSQPCRCSIFAQASRRETVRLNTSDPGPESGSRQK